METVDPPLYLRSPQDFRVFLTDQFDGLNSVEKGDRFASSAVLFVRAQDWASAFPDIRLNSKKSGELGRDIVSGENSDGGCLYGESKFTLDGVEEFDGVLSKWRQVEFEARGKSNETLFGLDSAEVALPHYVLVSGTDIASIVRRYREQPGRGSRDFFDELEEQRRVRYYGINDIYKWLRESYFRQHGIPSDFKLASPHKWLRVGNAYVGAVPGSELVTLIDNHGDSLFFENIRPWLGGRGGVNSTIIETAREEPEKFLERNNGVTFRAQGVELDDNNKLTISRGNIINGCQTTMALWQARPTSNDLYVQVKVVDAEEQTDAWKIAESANLQNQVTLLELKLAQHLRPQVVSKHASRLGRSVKMAEPNSLEGVLSAVSRSDSSYSLARSLFLGIFSRKPNNLFADNYDRLRGGLISEFYALSPQSEDKLFDALFILMENGRRAIDDAAARLIQNEDSEAFARVFEEGGAKYRALILLLAASGLLRIDLSARDEIDQVEAKRLDRFIDKLVSSLRTDTGEFARVCRYAVHTLFSDVTRDADDQRRLKQYLFNRTESTPFNRLYQGLVRSLDLL